MPDGTVADLLRQASQLHVQAVQELQSSAQEWQDRYEQLESLHARLDQKQQQALEQCQTLLQENSRLKGELEAAQKQLSSPCVHCGLLEQQLGTVQALQSTYQKMLQTRNKDITRLEQEVDKLSSRVQRRVSQRRHATRGEPVQERSLVDDSSAPYTDGWEASLTEYTEQQQPKAKQSSDAESPQTRRETSPASASDTSPSDTKAKLRLGRGAKRPRCRYIEESPPSAKKQHVGPSTTKRAKVDHSLMAAETCDVSALHTDKLRRAGRPNLIIPETMPMQFDEDLHYYDEPDEASQSCKGAEPMDKGSGLPSPPSLSSTPMVGKVAGQRPGPPALSPISEATLQQTRLEDSSKEESSTKMQAPVNDFSMESSENSPPSSPVFNKARGPPSQARPGRHLSSPSLFDEDSMGSPQERAVHNADKRPRSMQPAANVSRPSPSMLTGRIPGLQDNSAADMSHPSPSLLPPVRPKPILTSKSSLVTDTHGKKLKQAKLSLDIFQPTKLNLVDIPNFNGGCHGEGSTNDQEEQDYAEAIKRSLEDVAQACPQPTSPFKKPALPTTPKQKKIGSPFSPRRSPRHKKMSEEYSESQSLPDLPSAPLTHGAHRRLKLTDEGLNGSIDPGVHLSQYETVATFESGSLDVEPLLDLEDKDLPQSQSQQSATDHSQPHTTNFQATSSKQRKLCNSHRHKTSPNKADYRQEPKKVRRSPRKLPPPAADSLEDPCDEISASCSSVVFNSKQATGQLRSSRHKEKAEEEAELASENLDPNSSFDKLPAPKRPDYAYVDVVRKQAERRQLPAYDCPQCEKYYSSRGLSAEQRQEVMKNCRHRARFAPPETPDHYWSVGFPDTQQCEERGYLNTTQVKPSAFRRKRPLRLRPSPGDNDSEQADTKPTSR